MSLIGIPPFIGFKVKYMILELYYNNILLLLGVILSSMLIWVIILQNEIRK